MCLQKNKTNYANVVTNYLVNMKTTKSMIFNLFIFFIVLILLMSSLLNHLPEMNFNYNVNNEFTFFQNNGGNIDGLKFISNFSNNNSDQLNFVFKKNQKSLSQNVKYIYYVTRDFYKRFGKKKLYYNKNYFKERKHMLVHFAIISSFKKKKIPQNCFLHTYLF